MGVLHKTTLASCTEVEKIEFGGYGTAEAKTVGRLMGTYGGEFVERSESSSVERKLQP